MRKRKPLCRTSGLDLALLQSERDLIERAASISQLCMSDFARPLLLAKAKEIVESANDESVAV